MSLPLFHGSRGLFGGLSASSMTTLPKVNGELNMPFAAQREHCLAHTSSHQVDFEECFGEIVGAESFL
jgi:hypothetical protein